MKEREIENTAPTCNDVQCMIFLFSEQKSTWYPDESSKVPIVQYYVQSRKVFLYGVQCLTTIILVATTYDSST